LSGWGYLLRAHPAAALSGLVELAWLGLARYTVIYLNEDMNHFRIIESVVISERDREKKKKKKKAKMMEKSTIVPTINSCI